MKNNYKSLLTSKTNSLILAVLLLINNIVFPINLVIAQNAGAIWTTNGDCGEENQDVNHYEVGQVVYINGSGFDPNATYTWEITGQPGNASSDPNQVVASGSITINADGTFCFAAYTVLPGDDGEYTVDVGNKNDNYRVDGDETTPTPTLSITPTTIVTVTPSPTVTETISPTISITASPTPTGIPPAEEPTPTLTVTTSPTITVVPTITGIITPTVSPTITVTPTVTMTQSPTQTPIPTVQPTDRPIGGGSTDSSSNPVTEGIVSTQQSSSTSSNNSNSVVSGIQESYGQALGVETLPRTGESNVQSKKLPSGNTLKKNSYLFIPKIGVNHPIYQSTKIGKEYIVGHNEVLEINNGKGSFIYGHNTADTFQDLSTLQEGDTIFKTEHGKTVTYKVTSLRTITEDEVEVLNTTDKNTLTLMTCDLYNYEKRVIVTAVRAEN